MFVEGVRFLDAYSRNGVALPSQDNPFFSTIDASTGRSIMDPVLEKSYELGEVVYDPLRNPAEGLSTAQKQMCDQYFGGWNEGVSAWRKLGSAKREAHERLMQRAAQEKLAPEAVEELQLQLREDFERAANYFTFHVFNACMSPMWHRFVHGDWPNADRRSQAKIGCITWTQQAIARTAMRLFGRRQGVLERQGKASYFFESAKMNLVRKSFEGKGTESDVAILTLEVVRQATLEDPSLNLIVLPAPPQLDSSDFRQRAAAKTVKNPNIDFLLIDLDSNEVGGIQAKAWDGNRRFERKYDTAERVLIVSGSSDLQNRVRIPLDGNDVQEAHATPAAAKLFSWSGSLCVSIMTDFSCPGASSYKRKMAERVQQGIPDPTAWQADMATIANRVGPRMLQRAGVVVAENGFFEKP